LADFPRDGANLYAWKDIRRQNVYSCLNESYIVRISAANPATALIVGQGQVTIVTSHQNGVDNLLLHNSSAQLDLF
jgi:hypothetical protein